MSIGEDDERTTMDPRPRADSGGVTVVKIPETTQPTSPPVFTKIPMITQPGGPPADMMSVPEVTQPGGPAPTVVEMPAAIVAAKQQLREIPPLSLGDELEDEATRMVKGSLPKKPELPLIPIPRPQTSMGVKLVRKIPPEAKVAAFLALLGLALFILDSFRDHTHGGSAFTQILRYFSFK